MKRQRRQPSGTRPAAAGTVTSTAAPPAAPVPAWRPRAVLPVLLAAGCLVKLAVLLQLRDHPLLQPHGAMDTAYYVDLAQRFAHDGLLGVGEPFFVSPLYVYFLALVFSAGGGLLAAKLVQLALGTAAVGLLYFTARHWFGPRAAAWAAALAVLTGLFTFYEVLILQSALDPFLVALALHAVTRATVPGSRRPGAWAAWAGCAVGLFVLNRPNALIYAPVAAALLAARWHGQGRTAVARALVAVGLFGAGVGGVLALNAARNLAASGEAVAIASHGGLNFYVGNHAGADGTYSPVPGIAPSIAGQDGDSRRVAEAATGRRLSSREVSSYFYRRGLEWIAGDPMAAVRLFVRKIGILVNRVNVPLNYSYAYYSHDESPVLRWLIVGAWFLVPLGLVGLFWPSLRLGSRGYWAWGAFVPAYAFGVAAFFVTSRYRMPLLFALCAPAGAALSRLVHLARHGPRLRLRWPVAVAFALALTGGLDLGLDDGRGGEQTRRAVWLVEQGSVDDAQAYVRQIAPAHSHPGVLAYRVGLAYLDAGQPGAAAESLQRALAIDGPQPAIGLALGRALLRAGRPSDAIDPLSSACAAGWEIGECAPLLVRSLVAAGRTGDALDRVRAIDEAGAGEGPEAALDFGTLALEQGAPAEAERWLRLASRRAPDSAEACEKLGVALFLQERPAEAAPLLERACRLAPSSASAHLNLAAVYAELGRVSDAVRHAEEAGRLDPAEPRVPALLRALARR